MSSPTYMTQDEYQAWTLEFLKQLRTAGVSKWSGQLCEQLNPITVEFFSPTAVLETAGVTGPKSIAQALSDIEATDKCKCGHTEAAHNAEGECLQGCELEVCYPGNNEPPPKPEVTLEG